MKMSKRIFKSDITLFVMSAMIFSVSLWPSVQGATCARTKSNAAALKDGVSIRIGRSRRECSGFGLCSVTITISRISGGFVRAELSTAADGQLQLTLLDKAPEEGQTLFVDQDIQLSQDIAQKL